MVAIVVLVLLTKYPGPYERLLHQNKYMTIFAMAEVNEVPKTDKINVSEVEYRPQLMPSTLPSNYKQHIGFLKVHKAASTTTQGILLRNGWVWNLTFILPPEFGPFFYPNIISLYDSVNNENILPSPPGRKYDILCHHVVYDKDAWAKVLPADAAIIGTIREPLAHFRSVVWYFSPLVLMNMRNSSDDPIAEFLSSKKLREEQSPQYTFLNNRLSFEYGVPVNVITSRNITAFNAYVNDVLDKEFSVVIIAERFNEGLVLMKRMLNWNLQDILYTLKNRNEGQPIITVTEDHREMHKEYSSLDYLLYEHFVNRFNRQIELVGKSFQREVEQFKKIREDVETFCHDVNPHNDFVAVPESEFNAEFRVDTFVCELMHIGEIPFTQKIRARQYGAALWKTSGSDDTEESPPGY